MTKSDKLDLEDCLRNQSISRPSHVNTKNSIEVVMRTLTAFLIIVTVIGTILINKKRKSRTTKLKEPGINILP